VSIVVLVFPALTHRANFFRPLRGLFYEAP